MVLLALAAPFLTPPALPVWTYTYDLPSTPTALVRGMIQPLGNEALNGFPASSNAETGKGTGVASPTSPLRLSDLVPELAKEKGFALGERLDRGFIERAEKATDAPTFTTNEGKAQVGYSLDATNRIQGAIYTVPVSPAESEARFAAIRVRLDRQLGAPSYGRREGDESLTLVWQRSDRTTATLGLTAQDGTLGMGVVLADRNTFTRPIPARKG